MMTRVYTRQRTGGTPILQSGTSLFSTKYHLGTRNFCYLRTYLEHRNLVGLYCASLTHLGMKHDWTDSSTVRSFDL
jgi:hypothetical protein